MKAKSEPVLGEVIELMYPEMFAKDLAAFLGMTQHQIRHYVKTRRLLKGRNRKPLGYTTKYHKRVVVKMNDDHPQQHRRFAFATVLAWEAASGRKVPTTHAVVLIDGDADNLEPDNLYCLPRSELLAWARFIRQPVEVTVDQLWRDVMALDTSAKVQQKLLDLLERVVDLEQPLDIMRQRAACETAQTLINLLRTEIAYIQVRGGDGEIPFLDEAREANKRHKANHRRRQGLLAGPAEDHPWRGLGSKEN
ncbi:MAG TPA: HNH endonuclease [Ramlibacter sp.]|jgi:hypothetical protein|nr:HNH endonuclease [Ramlibacter sp.]